MPGRLRHRAFAKAAGWAAFLLLAAVPCLAHPKGALPRPTQWAAVERACLTLEPGGTQAAIAGLPSALDRAFWQSRAAFYTALGSQAPASYDAFDQATEALLSLCEEEGSAAALAYEAEGYFAKGIALVLRGRRLAAFWDLRRAYQRLRAFESKYPSNERLLKLGGLFDAAVAAVPADYQWMARVLGFEGNMGRGMGRLAQAARPEAASVEGGLIYALALKHLADNPAASGALIDSLQQAHPASPLLLYLRASSLADRWQSGQALEMLSAPANRALAGRMPLLHLSLGRALLLANRPTEAGAVLGLFATAYKGTLLRTEGAYRQGLATLLGGQAGVAQQAFCRAAALPKTEFDDDRTAAKSAAAYCAQLPTPRQLHLLRARLQFDGGHFAEGLASLAAYDAMTKPEASLPPAPGEQTERYYREGRLLQALARKPEAEAAYSRAAGGAPSGPALWMQAFSLYYGGQLALARGDSATARQRFVAALAFKGYDYRASLEPKLRATLGGLAPSRHGKR